jgi:hypothetical protein
MKQPTKQMAREYRNIAKHFEWTWRENKGTRVGLVHVSGRESYLYLAGHRIATVFQSGFKYEAHCPGGLVAYRETLAGAKAAAVAAVKAWTRNAIAYATGEPGQDAI